MNKISLIIILTSITFFSCSSTIGTVSSSSNYFLINDIHKNGSICYFHLTMVKLNKDVENPYTSLNDSVLQLQSSPDVQIIMQTYSKKEDGNYNFNQEIKLPDFINKYNSADSYYKSIPFEIKYNSKQIIQIKEYYIP